MTRFVRDFDAILNARGTKGRWFMIQRGRKDVTALVPLADHELLCGVEAALDAQNERRRRR
jgi:hypothetical protein